MRTRRGSGSGAFAILSAGVVCLAMAGAAAAAARFAVALDGGKNAVAETNMGNLVADAMRSAVNADFALVQASALQPVIVPAGELDDDAIRSLLVFLDDTITVIRLERARIIEALERSLGLLPHPNKGFLHLCGLRVRFDARCPPGSRILSVVAATTNMPLEPGKDYRVAVPESLAKGALGYFRVFNSAPRERTLVTLAQALARFAAASSPLVPRVEGRLQPVE